MLDRLAHAAQADRTGRVGVGAAGGLGHAVDLVDREAGAPEELEDGQRDGRRAGDVALHPPAEDRAQPGEHELVGEAVGQAQAERHGPAGQLPASHRHADPLGPAEDALARR